MLVLFSDMIYDNVKEMVNGKECFMNKECLLKLAEEFTDQSPKNYIQAETNADTAYVGMRIFDKPIIGVAAASDTAFTALLDPKVVGPHFILPDEWLPGAKSVISFFLPLSERVRTSNNVDKGIPSLEWLYGRIEGGLFKEAISVYLLDEIKKSGYQAVSTLLDKRFRLNLGGGFPHPEIPPHNCNWSERHVAYVCGLGTFGWHTNLISKKGTSGYYFSIITDIALEPTVRDYAEYLDYCIKCGACIRKCPAAALSENDKSIQLCQGFIRGISLFFNPRYGCGKCFTGVPCESRNPSER